MKSIGPDVDLLLADLLIINKRKEEALAEMKLSADLAGLFGQLQHGAPQPSVAIEQPNKL